MRSRLAAARATRPSGGWAVALLVVLAVALMLPAPAFVRDAPARTPAVDRLDAVLAGLPDDPLVVVGFDPDIGTYAEIRAAVRTLLGRLLASQATTVMVSFTPEGRALAGAELARLRAANANLGRTLHLGFVPGAEAGLVASVHELIPDTARGRVPDAVRRREAGSGFAAFDIAVVVGGNDLGPRSWVEQVRPRVPRLPIVAIAPTFQQPELAPYVDSGQLAALLGTRVDLEAWAARSEGVRAENRGREPERSVAVLVGMLIAVAVLLRAALIPPLRRLRGALARGRG